MQSTESTHSAIRLITPDDLRNAAKELPPSPQVFGKLGKLLRDTGTDLNDITNLVNTDSSLTTRVLILSNSAAFATDLAIDNLDDAINRIGFRELFKLVGRAAASDIYADKNSTYIVEGSLLWENALCCGFAMESLAQKLGLEEQESYTLGLLRSIGKMVIDKCVATESSNLKFIDGETHLLLDWEEASFGITNPAVASFLLSSWNFPNETVSTIRQQYQADSGEEGSSPLPLMLNLSGRIAEDLGKAIPGETVYWKSTNDQVKRIGLNERHIEEIRESVSERLNEILSIVNN